MNLGPNLKKGRADLTAIGVAIKTERKKLGMTQVQVSEQLGVSLKSLRNLEQGYGGVSIATALNILEMFGKEIRVGDIVVSPTKAPNKRPRKQRVIETLTLIKPILEKKFNIVEIALFGSCARDKAKKGSDIDIAVKYSVPPDLTTIGKLIVFLETLFDGHKVDIVEFEKMIPEVKVSAKEDFIYV